MQSPKIIPFPAAARRRERQTARTLLALLEALVTAAIGICTVFFALVILTML